MATRVRKLGWLLALVVGVAIAATFGPFPMGISVADDPGYVKAAQNFLSTWQYLPRGSKSMAGGARIRVKYMDINPLTGEATHMEFRLSEVGATCYGYPRQCTWSAGFNPLTQPRLVYSWSQGGYDYDANQSCYVQYSYYATGYWGHQTTVYDTGAVQVTANWVDTGIVTVYNKLYGSYACR